MTSSAIKQVNCGVFFPLAPQCKTPLRNMEVHNKVPHFMARGGSGDPSHKALLELTC